MTPVNPNNCPIIERTGDGRRVGRCMFHCPDDVCPRHGDVRPALERFRGGDGLSDELRLKYVCRGCGRRFDGTRGLDGPFTPSPAQRISPGTGPQWWHPQRPMVCGPVVDPENE